MLKIYKQVIVKDKKKRRRIALALFQWLRYYDFNNCFSVPCSRMFTNKAIISRQDRQYRKISSRHQGLLSNENVALPV